MSQFLPHIAHNSPVLKASTLVTLATPEKCGSPPLPRRHKWDVLGAVHMWVFKASPPGGPDDINLRTTMEGNWQLPLGPSP